MMNLVSYHINELLSPIMKKKGINHGRIFLDWPNIVGEKVAQFSWPQKIVRDRQFQNKESKESKDHNSNLSILYIEVSNSSFATELKYLENHLIEKISVYFGYKAISQIKVKINLQSRSSLPTMVNSKLTKEQDLKLEDSVAEINEEELRCALKNLGAISQSYNQQHRLNIS
jgi:hypothetical protein